MVKEGKQERALSQAEVQTSLHRKDLNHTAGAGGPLRSLTGKVQEVSVHYLVSQEMASSVSSKCLQELL